ncbi:PREDICTED: U-box domain-containing protein 52 [Tarenaya hassleriana]|uniref:U-box domain-containing protein 52 n=1 Tax=Tarenaya hassleriana TaxID=28532 RepID=UPI00053C3EF2|nr:PREDICTED: U-box domain-containing protein 52 [Tarenaya hassleriana]XP_010546148.1 PREDICTED: U-box domain-containing protein 52 [Tarenaya hassleriana]XP_010546149.1 PREDICTED: U-box domain-containing protein 52 [Tarenaya hassleriana]XP_010546150.1 PREDICTED: U-box domain-containing protein 52 [Tarenaya hassleriana]
MADHQTGRSLSEHLLLPPPPLLSSAVIAAINGKKRSKYVVFWALEKFIPEGFTDFKLVYVRPPITSVPTPMGNTIPISEVRDDVASAYRQEVEWNTSEVLRPYLKMCERRKVQVEVLVLESDDIAAAIAEEIARSSINKLVIGLSIRGFFSRKIDMSSMIAAAAPSFCTVYVISKMKLASVRPSEGETTNITIRYEGTERSSSTSDSTGDNPGLQSEFQDLLSFASEAQSRVHPPLPSPKQQTLPGLVRMDTSSTETDQEGLNASETYHLPSWGSRWRDLEERREIMSSSSSNNREIVSMDWGTTIPDNSSWTSHQASNMSEELLSMHSVADNQVSLSFEIEKLRAELKHVQEMYAMAQTETVGASRKLDELNQRRFEEWERLEGLKAKEEEAKEAAAKEKKRYEEATKEAERVRELMAKEAMQRREAEIKAERDAKEKEKLELALVKDSLQYQHYTWEEILASTSNFSEDLKIGIGAYGTVYKCNLHHTIAAVKVLHAGETQLSKQFDQELQILSKIRHPHLVLLLGACPERGCLVYEYMDNGSLEDCLMLVNDRPPIPWFDRFRIAWEVASALVFLHKSKPKPIIHRDLKPGNILLDNNFVSKLGDVGLSTVVNQDDPSSKLTIYKKTSPVGTLCYIDPEYQRTGMISTKSDVYSLGIVILQLITAKPAIAITQMMEDAISEDDAVFMEVLDGKAGAWPINETREFAALGLCCTELRGRDRPDLEDQILPVLERLRKVTEKASQNSLSQARTSPPSHFVCPLLKDVMNEPCVAADGYTYDRECIEEWFRDHNTSPVTNLPLLNKNLLPNYTLYTAIMEWKSKKK